MNLVFESTKKFEKDIAELPKREAERVISRLNQNCSLLKQEPAAFYRTVHRPIIPQLTNGMESTLYSMRVGRDIRILLTIDEDPLFDQVIVTLLRLVRHKDLEKAFKSIAESLYQSALTDFSKGEDHGAT